MRFIKRIITALLVLTVIGVLFRGWFYRHLVTYRSIGTRTNYSAKNKVLINYIDANSRQQNSQDVKPIIELALSLTARKLNFTAGKNNIDPNKLITSKAAHCVGYATFFAATCNYLLQKEGLANNWTAKPQIGQLYLLGENVHKYVNSPFFKDHDFVTIENQSTGEIFAVDPTVNDYLAIDFVTYRNDN